MWLLENVEVMYVAHLLFLLESPGLEDLMPLLHDTIMII